MPSLYACMRENEHRMSDRIEELSKENESLNQFKNKVFRLLDHNINQAAEFKSDFQKQLSQDQIDGLILVEAVLSGIKKELLE